MMPKSILKRKSKKKGLILLDKTSVGLVQKQPDESMEKNRKSETDPVPHGNLLQNKRGTINHQGKDGSPKTLTGNGEIVHYMKKKQIGALSQAHTKGKSSVKVKL